MSREWKMVDAGSRPEPRRFPVRLVVILYLAVCAVVVLGAVMYAAGRRTEPEDEGDRHAPPPRQAPGSIRGAAVQNSALPGVRGKGITSRMLAMPVA